MENSMMSKNNNLADYIVAPPLRIEDLLAQEKA
jgi:hypothetical protein